MPATAVDAAGFNGALLSSDPRASAILGTATHANHVSEFDELFWNSKPEVEGSRQGFLQYLDEKFKAEIATINADFEAGNIGVAEWETAVAPFREKYQVKAVAFNYLVRLLETHPSMRTSPLLAAVSPDLYLGFSSRDFLADGDGIGARRLDVKINLQSILDTMSNADFETLDLFSALEQAVSADLNQSPGPGYLMEQFPELGLQFFPDGKVMLDANLRGRLMTRIALGQSIDLSRAGEGGVFESVVDSAAFEARAAVMSGAIERYFGSSLSNAPSVSPYDLMAHFRAQSPVGGSGGGKLSASEYADVARAQLEAIKLAGVDQIIDPALARFFKGQSLYANFVDKLWMDAPPQERLGKAEGLFEPLRATIERAAEIAAGARTKFDLVSVDDALQGEILEGFLDLPEDPAAFLKTFRENATSYEQIRTLIDSLWKTVNDYPDPLIRSSELFRTVLDYHLTLEQLETRSAADFPEMVLSGDDKAVKGPIEKAPGATDADLLARVNSALFEQILGEFASLDRSTFIEGIPDDPDIGSATKFLQEALLKNATDTAELCAKLLLTFKEQFPERIAQLAAASEGATGLKADLAVKSVNDLLGRVAEITGGATDSLGDLAARNLGVPADAASRVFHAAIGMVGLPLLLIGEGSVAYRDRPQEFQNLVHEQIDGIVIGTELLGGVGVLTALARAIPVLNPYAKFASLALWGLGQVGLISGLAQVAAMMPAFVSNIDEAATEAVEIINKIIADGSSLLPAAIVDQIRNVVQSIATPNIDFYTALSQTQNLEVNLAGDCGVTVAFDQNTIAIGTDQAELYGLDDANVLIHDGFGVVQGGGGNDLLVGIGPRDPWTPGTGDEGTTQRARQELKGDAGKDLIVVTAGDNRWDKDRGTIVVEADGGDGDDLIVLGEVPTLLNGGAGEDILSFAKRDWGQDLEFTVKNTGGATEFTIKSGSINSAITGRIDSIEVIVLSEGDDTAEIDTDGIPRATLLFGAGDEDLARFTAFGEGNGLTVTLSEETSPSSVVESANDGQVLVRLEGGGNTYILGGAETIELTARPDRLQIAAGALALEQTIDLGESARNEDILHNVDVVDYSKTGSGLNYYYGHVSTRSASVNHDGLQQQGFGEEMATIVDAFVQELTGYALGYNENLIVRNAEKVVLTGGDDAFLGGPVGTFVETGGGADKVWYSPGVAVTDLSFEDRVALFGVLPLYGGLRQQDSEDAYASTWGGLIKYSLTSKGELAIATAWSRKEGATYAVDDQMYITNWGAEKHARADGAGEIGPGNIFLAEFDITAERIVNPYPNGYSIWNAWQVFGLIAKSMVGIDGWGGGDPLVLDLDGDGIEVTPFGSLNARFDIDGDLYAERTALAGSDDGMLARDLDGNGRIDDARELFGIGRTPGFSVLETLDGNLDGRVDADDDGLADFNGDGVANSADSFDQLLVWQDANENGVTDEGELLSVTARGITGISLDATAAEPGTLINGSRLDATADFTWSDGSTGVIGDVVFRTDNLDSVYVGAPIEITATAEALPDLFASGTLVTLRQAMSLRPESAAAVEAALAGFTSPDFAVLRDAVRPILVAWAEGAPMRTADGEILLGPEGLNDYPDLTIVKVGDDIVDYNWRQEEETIEVEGVTKLRTTWTFVSGVTYRLVHDLGTEAPTVAELRNLWLPDAALTSDTGDIATRSLTWSDAVSGETLTVTSGTYPGVQRNIAPENFDIASFPVGEEPTYGAVLGQDFAVWERLIGESLAPFFIEPDSVAGARNAMTELLGRIDRGVELYAARVAVQGGPLSSYFSSIHYDAETNGFRSNDNDQLAGVFEAVLGAASAAEDPFAWLRSWQPLLDTIISDYSRGASYQLNTYGFLAQNFVAGYERAAASYDFVTAAEAIGLPEDLLLAGSGDRAGTNDADIFYLDASDQVLAGAGGADTYVAGRVIGHDVIDDSEPYLGNRSGDTLRFSYHTPSDIVATRDGIDLVLTVAATGESIRIKRQFDGEAPGPILIDDLSDDTGVKEIVFADGTVWSGFDFAYAVSRVDAAGTTVEGTADNDVLDGGAGNDILLGGGDGDIYVVARGDGNDVIEDHEDNVFRDGIDVLKFEGGITAGELTFSRVGQSNDLTIGVTGASDSITILGQFTPTYTGVLGTYFANQIEYLVFDDGSGFSDADIRRTLIRNNTSAGDDVIFGFVGEDVLDGGAGDDYLAGGAFSDTYVFGRGYGHDIVHDDKTTYFIEDEDRLVFKHLTLPDLTVSHFGKALTFTVNDTGESVTIDGQYDRLYFDDQWGAIELFDFADGTEMTIADFAAADVPVIGTSGNDILHGSDWDELIDGGAGDDELWGHGDNDIYVFGLGYGHDTIYESNEGLGPTDDTVRFNEGVAADAVTVERDGSDLVLSIDGQTDRLRIADQFSLWYRQVERFEFFDGTVWTGDQIKTWLTTGTADNDTILGFTTDDTLIGGLGDDSLDGSFGDDTYLYARGDGNDIITEAPGGGTNDTLSLSGITPEEVSVARSGDDVVLTISGPGGAQIILKKSFMDLAGIGVDRITFADATEWTRADLQARMLTATSTAGDDTITGFNTDDTLAGGLGNDAINGGDGDDTYLYARGDGDDTITEDAGNGFADRVVFLDFDQTAVSLVRSGNDVTLVVAPSALEAGDGGSIRLVESLDDVVGQGVESVNFADGSSWTQADFRALLLARAATAGDDSIDGFNTDDSLSGGGGNDLLQGGSGDDSYVYARGDGDDTVSDGVAAGSADSLHLVGIAATEVTVARDGSDAILLIPTDGVAAAGTIRLVGEFSGNLDQGVESVTFEQDAPWTLETLRALYLAGAGTVGDDTILGFAGRNDLIDGGDGNDLLYGYSGDDVLNGGAGDDVLSGGDGTDSFDGGDGTDTIDYAGSSADWVFDLAAGTATAGGVTETVVSVENVTAGSGDDTLIGSTADNRLAGGGGSDTYHFSAGGGNDTIVETSGAVDLDVVELDGLDTADVTLVHRLPGNDLVITVTATGETLTVAGHFTSASTGVEVVRFADGSTLDRAALAIQALYLGSGGDDVITGTSAAETFDGGAGNDTVTGGAGSDTYRYGVGSGDDTVIETSGSVDTDVVRLVGLAPTDVTVGRSGDHLQIKINATGETLTVQNHFASTSFGIEQLVFADDTTWDRTQIQAAAWMFGTDGDDTISGTLGNDLFYGGKGNDTLNSGVGSDTFGYSSGDGNDTLNDPTGTAGEVDTLRFFDLDAGDLALSRVGNDLKVAILPTGDTITVTGQFLSATTVGIDAFRFADGSSWDRATIIANAWLRGTAGADTLTGSSGNDTLFGDAGADTLSGSGGSDIYVYRSGDGNDTINDNNSSISDTDTLRLTNLNAGDIALTRVGSDLRVDLAGTGENITIVKQFSSTTYNWGIESFEFADGSSWDRATINGNAWIRGTAGNDTLTGTTWADNLDGGAGDDTLDGGSGADTMRGGTGDDTYVVDNAGDVVTELAGEGNDTVQSKIAFTLGDNVENLTLTGVSSINGTGNELDNLITGNVVNNTLSGGAGNDTLNGGGGTDTLIGGSGDDLYVVDSSGDVVTEQADEGTDTVRSTITYTLGGNVENLALTGSSTINGTGNELDNIITGNAANNTLTGNAGNDTLDGGAGTDILTGGSGDDTYVLGRGYGSDSVTDNDATAGNHDVAAFGSDVGYDQLWFAQTGNNLVVSIIGTNDKLTVQNWYGGSDYHLEEFRAGDGHTLADSQVQNLVNAMASMTPPSLGQTTLTPAQEQDLQPVLAANWQ
ncbi:MAG: hypothetical protein GC191_16695 [Azospirillum sp.]|nr:hypothetical protein [Azospirillum sp.]